MIRVVILYDENTLFIVHIAWDFSTKVAQTIKLENQTTLTNESEWEMLLFSAEKPMNRNRAESIATHCWRKNACVLVYVLYICGT